MRRDRSATTVVYTFGPPARSPFFSMPSFDVVSEANLVEVRNAIDQTNKEVGTRFDFKGSDARGVDIRFLDVGKVDKIGGDKVKQVIKVRNGIESETAKKIVKAIKDAKMKVQASIQGDAVRVAGTKRDDLQSAIALLKKEVTDTPLGFNNFRD